MNEIKLKEESYNLEYKLEIPKSDKTWLKSIVSFSNTAGGELIIGVEDKTLKIVGIKEDRSIIEQRVIETIYNNIVPKPIVDISFKNVDGVDIVSVYIAKGTDTPYFIKNEGVDKGCYVRYGSTDRLATESERLELMLSKKNTSFTCEIYDKEGQKEKLNEERINNFLNGINDKVITKKLIDHSKLVEWNLIKKVNGNTYATNGYMILTINPFNCVVQIGVFEGNTKSKLNHEFIIEGSIIKQFDDTMEIVLKELENGYLFESKRKIKYKLPEVSIREIVANAIIHRNYLENHPIRISIFNDRIEVFSPGSLYDGLQIEEALSGISKLRNPNVAELFYHLGIIEKWGSGIIRANEELKNDSKKEIIFTVNNHGVNATLSMEPQNSIKINTLNIDNYLKNKQLFSRRELESDLNMTEHQARYYIEKWLKEGKVMKQGASTRSFYEVVK
jgi:predicted HTH transcriptional regulator